MNTKVSFSQPGIPTRLSGRILISTGFVLLMALLMFGSLMAGCSKKSPDIVGVYIYTHGTGISSRPFIGGYSKVELKPDSTIVETEYWNGVAGKPGKEMISHGTYEIQGEEVRLKAVSSPDSVVTTHHYKVEGRNLVYVESGHDQDHEVYERQ